MLDRLELIHKKLLGCLFYRSGFFSRIKNADQDFLADQKKFQAIFKEIKVTQAFLNKINVTQAFFEQN